MPITICSSDFLIEPEYRPRSNHLMSSLYTIDKMDIMAVKRSDKLNVYPIEPIGLRTYFAGIPAEAQFLFIRIRPENIEYMYAKPNILNSNNSPIGDHLQ